MGPKVWIWRVMRLTFWGFRQLVRAVSGEVICAALLG